MVAWFLGRCYDQFQHLSWGFVDQVTDNIQIEKKKGKFWHIFIPSDFSINWLLLPVLMNDLLYLMQNSTCFESS